MRIVRPVRFQGKGLHSAAEGSVLVEPAAPGGGIVVGTPRGPVPIGLLGRDGSRRSTRLHDPASGFSAGGFEHLLAALSALDAWDVQLTVQGDEIPILDGSALPFIEALSAACSPAPVPAARVLGAPIRVGRGDSFVHARPHVGFRVEVTIHFDHPMVGTQRACFERGLDDFARSVAPARTFGFLEEARELRSRGLALGADLDCALVLGPDSVLGRCGPRFEDEPARHKLLDLVGDMALVGRPLDAWIVASRPSHALSHALVDELLAGER